MLGLKLKLVNGATDINTSYQNFVFEILNPCPGLKIIYALAKGSKSKMAPNFCTKIVHDFISSDMQFLIEPKTSRKQTVSKSNICLCKESGC